MALSRGLIRGEGAYSGGGLFEDIQYILGFPVNFKAVLSGQKDIYNPKKQDIQDTFNPKKQDKQDNFSENFIKCTLKKL